MFMLCEPEKNMPQTLALCLQPPANNGTLGPSTCLKGIVTTLKEVFAALVTLQRADFQTMCECFFLSFAL